jgi:uncharacterized phage-associated protein
MSFDRSAPPAARTALDVAIWMLDRARSDDSHLPFQKLQRLLYLAQSLFAAQTNGALMPAVFLAEESGPIEPNLQRLLAGGRPSEVIVEAPSAAVREFLETLWQRYAAMPLDRLNGYVARNAAYVEARQDGRNSIIDIAAMAEAARASTAQPAESMRILRSQSGTAVAVRAWTPNAVQATAAPERPKR